MTSVDLGEFRTGRASELPTASALLPGPRNSVEGHASGALRTSVLLVDPDPVTRDALTTTLLHTGIGTVLEATSVDAVRDVIAKQPAGDLALVSLALGSAAGGVVVDLRAAGWKRVVALAPTADIGPVIDAVGSGVHGVLIGRRANPATAHLPTAIHELSAREVEVIQLVAEGRSNKWIGDQLSLSALTVKSHLARIGRKLGTGDRAHIVALALRAGIVS